MNLTFWSIAGLMVAAALLAVLPPLLGRSRRKGLDRGELNLAIHRERLAELEAEHERGNLDDADFQQAREETERALLRDVPPEESVRRRAGGRLLPVLVGLAVPVVAVLIYLQVGSREALDAGAAGGVPTQASVTAFISQLEAHTREAPRDVTGWLMLGRAYEIQNKLGEARSAYSRAYELAPENPDVLVGYAEVLARLNDNSLQGLPTELVQKALKADPENHKAMWLAGIAAFQSGDRARAIGYWKRLRSMKSTSPDERSTLDDFIAKAGGQAEAPAASAADSTGQGAGAPASATTADARLQVQVSLAPGVRDRVRPDDTVFVFAKAADGPPMPLAVVRKTVRDLPFTVTLDDSKAVVPGMSLSKFGTVIVGARVSRTGSATPSPGDPEGLSDALPNSRGQPIHIAIGEPAPGTSPETSPKTSPGNGAGTGAAGMTLGMSEGAPAQATGASAPKSAASSSLQVRVSLDPSLRDRVQPGETVFIFAKAANGPPMPLAVARRTVADLPFTVTLDDDSAMMPSLKLSQFPSVVVGARVSHSGGATRSPGDLEGKSGTVSPGSASVVQVSIGEVVH